MFIYQANIKFARNFKCSKCRIIKRGDTETLLLNDIDSYDLEATIAMSKVEARYMPVGWASFYNLTGTEFLCEFCKNKT